MRYPLAFLLFLCSVTSGMAQHYTIKGTLADTLNNGPLYRASVILIGKSDSVIRAFTRSKPDGSFELHVAKEGKYTLQISFPGFADFVEDINVNKSMVDMGVLPMVTKEHLLQEFVFKKQIAAIKMKGDTTEYAADSFKVKEGATVEDLLKRLPGIQVDRNGQITAQGETVQKILVDGEEFFSDDPKVVTQGLQANSVEKVQVYNKKSDQAEFTGIDDGEKTKTINLELKEDRKKGYFGKLDAGGGTDGYFQNQAMINLFKGKRQLSAFAIASNTDKVGLGWQDNGKFGSGSNGMTGDDGSVYFFNNNTDDNFGGWDGKYNGEGLPKVWTGGIHFADKWNEEKSHLSANYRYAMQDVEANGNTITQYTLKGDSSNINELYKAQFSKAERHGIDALYEWKIDSTNSLKVTLTGGAKNSEVLSTYTNNVSYLVGANKIPLYTNTRAITSNSKADFLNADLLYKKKFAKKGRTFSLDIKESDKDSKSDGHLNSTLTPDTANPISTKIDQRKVNNSGTVLFGTKATYTEPLSKVTFLEANYGLTVNNSTAQNYSYNANSASGDYNAFDSAYSSDYKYNVLTNSGGLVFRWADNKKINFSAGGDVSNARYTQTDLLHGDTSHVYNYLNFFPKANFRYKFSKQRSISFNYYGNTQQPTISEVQPLRQNTDPTNITIGNPALKQSFTHTISMWGNDYKVLTDRWIYINGSFSFVNNAIAVSQYTKEGINYNQYINVNGDYNASGWMGYGFKIKKLDINLGLDLSANTNHSNNFINGRENTNDNNSYSGSLRFSRYKEDKYDFSIRPGITYNENRATISTNTPSYWSSSTDVDGNVQLPKKFEIGSDVNFLFRQATVVFNANNNIIKWNAYAGKKFLKNHELELRITVFDILNQNIGYDRTARAGIITQNNYNTIRRYAMLSLVWNFTYKPAGAAAAGDQK